MTTDWSALRRALAALRRDGVDLPLWWRDDDAVKPTLALDHALQISAELRVPLHLAVIPSKADPALSHHLEATDTVALIHGWAHQNHAPAGEKKAEFGHRRPAAGKEAVEALQRMRTLFGGQLLKMFVPPWNRIDRSVTTALNSLGYCALSTFTPRALRQTAGLVQINTHIDPIHWRAGGGLVPTEDIIALMTRTLAARHRGEADAAEPLGLLTHHLVHDPALWAFTRACLSELLDGGATPCNLLTLKDQLP